MERKGKCPCGLKCCADSQPLNLRTTSVEGEVKENKSDAILKESVNSIKDEETRSTIESRCVGTSRKRAHFFQDETNEIKLENKSVKVPRQSSTESLKKEEQNQSASANNPDDDMESSDEKDYNDNQVVVETTDGGKSQTVSPSYYQIKSLFDKMNSLAAEEERKFDNKHRCKDDSDAEEVSESEDLITYDCDEEVVVVDDDPSTSI